MENKEFSRICSMCKRKMIFKLRKSYTNSLWKIPSNKNYKCRSCSEKGRIVTPEQRIQISNSLKGRVSWNNRIAETNVVLEYDSKYHKKLCQKQKDLVRQNKIIDILHPKKFWRYDAINKQFTNILEGSS